MGTEYHELGPLGRDLAIWEIHLRSTGKSTHTIRSYVQGVRALAGFLTDQGLPLEPEQITTRHLRAFQAHLLLPKDQGGAGKRTSTVCTRHDALKLFFGFLEEEDDLPNPMRRVRRPTEEEVTIQPLTEDQLAALIDTCRGKDFYDRRDMALIRMWVSTPARLSEIAMLRVVGADGEPDVDPLAGMIYVMGKGRRPRQMALSPKACKAAIRYEKVREQHLNAASPFYWLSHKKERFNQSGIRQMIARRAREAGIGHVHPHQFRHTYATTFLDHGGTESALMRQGGWRSRKVMERYTKTTADAARTARRARSTSATASDLTRWRARWRPFGRPIGAVGRCGRRTLCSCRSWRHRCRSRSRLSRFGAAMTLSRGDRASVAGGAGRDGSPTPAARPGTMIAGVVHSVVRWGGMGVDEATSELFEAIQRLHDEDTTVVTSVRLSASLREAVKAAVKAGMDDTPNDAMLNALHDRLAAFAQRLALDLHYERFPDARPSLVEIATAAAQLDDNPLAHEPDLLRRAADELVRLKPDADADDVLVYAAALRAGPDSETTRSAAAAS